MVSTCAGARNVSADGGGLRVSKDVGAEAVGVGVSVAMVLVFIKTDDVAASLWGVTGIVAWYG